ncbi:hypothetical protein Z043_112494 [Scleropages formosus]|uniref:Uncharacterized protein n=1 Tax=Scleropages formosus TaxID=113540 RepID=A0A0N8JZA6_SCLFO|nr:hypothetical protein Z043_112494 [Scleropages formosus]
MTQSWQSATLLLGALLAVVSAGLGASMPGAPVEADVNDPSLRNALQLAVAQQEERRALSEPGVQGGPGPDAAVHLRVPRVEPSLAEQHSGGEKQLQQLSPGLFDFA